MPNLVVMMVVKSLKSRGFLDEVFSWQWSYYFLNEDGVKFLVRSLGLQDDVVPSTYKKTRMTKKEDGKEGKEEQQPDEIEQAKAEAQPAQA